MVIFLNHKQALKLNSDNKKREKIELGTEYVTDLD